MPTIRKRGTRWQAQVRIKREGEVVFQDSASFDTKRHAEVWARALESKLDAEGFTPYLQGTNTVSDAMTAWVKSKGTVSRGLQHSTRQIMLSPFGETAIRSLTAKQIVDWASSLTVAPATVLHHVMVLRSAMNSTLPLMGVEPNLEPIVVAMQHLKRSRITAKSQERTRRVEDEEIETIVQHLLTKDFAVPTHTYIRLAVVLPRRREELLTMRWEDYNPKAGTLLLRDTKNPTAARREIIPVPPAAQDIINKLERFHDCILPYKPDTVSAAFQRAVRSVGLEDIRLHDLRHEGISRLFEQGLQIQEVALISGHVSWAALKRYTHIKPSAVLEKLNHARKQTTQKADAQSA